MKHLDLFSGIGGFALAVDRVWHEEENEHIFVEWDDFCTEVLKKHWPEAEYHKDIREFVADPKRTNGGGKSNEGSQNKKWEASNGGTEGIQPENGQAHSNNTQSGYFLITGGFPCQPFSQAGRRKGTEDDRYLWPPMLECVSLFRPEWVIAENVGGLVTWNDGLVLQTVCADLESEGYEVQPFIIPAVSVGAPHRRDRVWIVARSNADDPESGGRSICIGQHERKTTREINVLGNTNTNALNSPSINVEGKRKQQEREEQDRLLYRENIEWRKNWLEVATRLCRVDDGVPRRMDRNPRLKALGNAIVPQVAEEIMKAIKQTQCNNIYT